MPNDNHYPAGAPQGKGGQFAPKNNVSGMPTLKEGLTIEDFLSALKSLNEQKSKPEEATGSVIYEGRGRERLIDVFSRKIENYDQRAKMHEAISDADDELSGILGDFWNKNRQIELILGNGFPSQYEEWTMPDGRGGLDIIAARVTIGEGFYQKSNYYAKGEVIFHESAHALNRALGNNLHKELFSERFVSKKHQMSMTNMIKSEINQNLNEENYKALYSEFKNFMLEEKQKALSIDKEVKRIVDLANLEFSKNGNPQKFNELMQESLKLYHESFAIKQAREAKRAKKYGVISDMLQASLGDDFDFGFGHPKGYFAGKLGRENRGDEAFAEIYAAKATNPECLEVLKKYIPKTLEIFDEIIEYIKTGRR